MSTSNGPKNSAQPTTSTLAGATYNATTPAPVDGQVVSLQADSSGNLKVVLSGGGGGATNVNIADVSGNPPALSNPLPVELSDGTNAFGSASNPLSVNVISGGGSNASVGVTGATAPTSATEIGVIDGTGKLQGASSSNPVRVDPTGTTAQPVSGTVTGNQGTANTLANKWPVQVTDGTNTMPTGDTSARTIHTTVDNASIAVTGTTTANQGTANATPWNENVTQWGATAVTAAQQMPATAGTLAGTETAPLVRPIGRKFAEVLASSLAGSATFTSAWFDSSTDGTLAVAIRCFPTQSLASGTFQQTDDQTQGNFSSVALPISTSTPFQAVYPVTARYWRVVLINGATLQGAAFQLTQSRLPFCPNVGANGMFPQQAGVTTGTAAIATSVLATSGLADGSTTVGFVDPNTAVRAPQVAVCEFTGSGSVASTVVAKRTPNFFKTAQATASGNTALWTPTAGKKFRLMRFLVDLTSNSSLAAGAVLTISFQDSASAMPVAFDVFVPTTAVTTGFGGYTSGWVDLGNGILSAVANNVLNVNLSAALVAAGGVVRVTCCGTEE